MLGAGDPTPYDLQALALLVVLALVLLAGCVFGPGWSPEVGRRVRWTVLVLAAVIVLAVSLVTPTGNGIVGAGRLLTLWPAAALNLLLFVVWSWRAGRLS